MEVFNEGQPEVIDPTRLFYVSAIDGHFKLIVAGPFERHADALAAVRAVKTRAEHMDCRTFWWAWGTCSVPREVKVKTVFPYWPYPYPKRQENTSD